MAETPRISAFLRQRRKEAEQARERLVYEFARSRQATIALAFTCISFYAAFATFGIEWARLAGASSWEAAVWPVALTATTAQAFYCWLRTSPAHPGWVGSLFATITAAGFSLACIGNMLYLGEVVHQLHPAVSTSVKAAPGFCLILSCFMAAIYILTVRPFEYDQALNFPAPPPGGWPAPPAPDNATDAERADMWWELYQDRSTRPRSTDPESPDLGEDVATGPGRNP